MEPYEYSLLRPELVGHLLPVAAGFCACLAASLATGRFLLCRVRRQRLLPLGNRGTTELEFALALPFFLVSVLITVQVALMINANLVVDYAAFCAARSAAVWVPADASPEGPNAIAEAGDQNSEKWVRIRRAATMACVPISPRISRFRFGLVPPPSQGLDQVSLGALAQASGATLGGQLDFARLAMAAADKYVYADYFTDVALEDESGEGRTEFGEGATVTARVTHKFEMAVPFAGQILGAAFGDRYLGFIGGYYVPLTASYTLMLAHT